MSSVNMPYLPTRSMVRSFSSVLTARNSEGGFVRKARILFVSGGLSNVWSPAPAQPFLEESKESCTTHNICPWRERR